MVKLAVMAVASTLLVSCSSSRKERVVVAFPSDWSSEGEYRNCYLNGPGYLYGFDPGPGRGDLPKLDCDRFVSGEVIHYTPQSRMLLIEVAFRGQYALAKETTWICRRSKDSLECRSSNLP
jgi:hypothetical protein